MFTKKRVALFSLMIAFVFLISAIYTIPAYADGETPPVEPPVATEPAEPPTQDEVAEEAAPPTPPEIAPVTDEIPPAESVESVLAEVPQGTEVVIVNEEGETVPLVTEEAAEIIITGDPLWCPATKAVPTPGVGGCSASFASLADLVTELSTVGGLVTNPGMDGVIWIASNYNAASDNAAILIDSGTLSVMSTFKLTLKGGWCDGTDVTCAGLIDVSKPSTFDVPIVITGWTNDVTLSNITITGTSSGTNALEVGTTKNITLTNVKSNNNTGRGANLHNGVSGTGNVTVTNSQFNLNTGVHGLLISSNGIITLKDVTASNNSNGFGAVLTNDSAPPAAPKAVTLSGTNTFSYNGTSSGSSGLHISSLGAITVNNVIASNNGNGGNGQGAELYNDIGSSTSGVTLTGTNVFSDNQNNGLFITTFGAVKANNVYSNSNGNFGAFIFNSSAGSSQAVTFTGTNEFKYNALGLSVSSKGQITLNNVSANSNGNVGASLNNTPSATSAGVTLTGTNSFSGNFYHGINIQSFGIVTLSNITANGNGTSNTIGYGASINNVVPNFKGVTLTGFNSFNDNFVDGLVILSGGIITLNNITANNSETGYGARIDNTSSGSTFPKAVTLAGVNIFNNNDLHGLYINSYGAITTNNVTANDNGQGGSFGAGADLNNAGASTGQIVAVKGANNFSNNLDSGLYVLSLGAISTNAVTAGGNGEYGVFLANDNGTAASTITMTGSNLITGNALDNLNIQSASTILLNNITASFSTSGMGAFISNTFGVAKAVTISGTNAFNSNGSMGLFVLSNGLITINNLTAGSNGGNSAYLNNTTSTIKAGVTLTGVNTFNGNTAGHGLLIQSLGNVKTNAVTANLNGGYGVQIDITAPGAIGTVTMSGANNFNANVNSNLNITAVGAITLNNINSTASVSADGASIDNTLSGTGAPKPITLNGTNIFSGNTNGGGLVILSYGVITTNNLTASNNGGNGGYISNSGAVVPAGINILGTNLFDSNTGGGLFIESKGLIKTNNITSNNSTTSFGADFNNNISGSTAGVTMTGTNVFNNNVSSGLDVITNGVITASNISASFTTNGFGASLDNLGSPTTNAATPKAITLTGNNNFNSNRTSGLVIDTYGAVTINNLTANSNGLGMANGVGADIDNYKLDSTIASNINLTGNNTFLGNYENGLLIDSYGAIKVNNLKADDNGNSTVKTGAQLINNFAPSNALGVTLTGTNTFINNGFNGLFIMTKGAVLLNNINASDNASYGLSVDNQAAGTATPKPVTVTGTNIFNSNSGVGFFITTYGAITLSNMTASNNNSYGGFVENQSASIPANIVFTGFNTFNDNDQYGLTVNSAGAVTLSNVTANNNILSGLYVDNTAGSAGVTLTGVNSFNNNGDYGATLASDGAVNLTRITADENGNSGLIVSTTGAVTLTCGSFYMNTDYGWEVTNTTSLLTLKGVFTAGNGLGPFINNALATVTVRNCPLP